MDHLATAYPVGPRGQWITPALAQDLEAAKHGLDRYADSVAYTGLSLVATSWAASVQDVSAAGSLASDRQSGYVVGQDISRIALVRTPSLWFAVKQARSDKIDLRYDFGLVALKAKATDGSWQNVVPSLPKVQGHPDSAGPTLASSHGPAYASGSHISVARDGTVRVIGSFTTAIGRRVRVRSAAFSYRPTGDCVTLSFAVHHGERMSYSAFVRPGAAASVNGVTANGERVSITPAAAAYQVEHGFSSGSDARLDRVRFALRGSGVIRIATCSA
jgi:hypothetical protein